MDRSWRWREWADTDGTDQPEGEDASAAMPNVQRPAPTLGLQSCLFLYDACSRSRSHGNSDTLIDPSSASDVRFLRNEGNFTRRDRFPSHQRHSP